mmetsp:Transcript_40082/g.96772  ORF Transcript_40082/g.96772 Transcript_40082/m.96772 type:complete len:106 (+) Transcript_40082:1476-1793(+)
MSVPPWLGLLEGRSSIWFEKGRKASDATSLATTDVESVRQQLAVCERVEVYWKMKVKEEKATQKDTREMSCRVNSGSSVVLANVKPFMDSAIILRDSISNLDKCF